MINKKILTGILVMALVFGMTVVVVEAQSNRGGEFILTNIPGRYDGKYVTFQAEDEDGEFGVVGGDSIDPQKRSQIIDGKVIIPLWITRDGKKFERYSGNHSLDVRIEIHNSPVDDDSKYLELVLFMYASPANRLYVGNCKVNFSNGSVTKSYNDRNRPKN